MKERTSQTLLIGKEAWAFLKNECRKQRGLNPISDSIKDKMWSRRRKVNGKAQIMDDSFGGGDGTYTGKWTSWSLEDMKGMLDKEGYEYEIGEPVKYINL